MIFKLIDWYLRRVDQRRIPDSSQFDTIPVEVQRFTSAAILLARGVAEADQSGEWKRHQVYAKLIKLYPEAKRRDLGWAIERAIRRI